MNSIIDEIKSSFKSGSMLTKLIYINLGVFVVIKIAAVFTFLIPSDNPGFSLVYWLAVPADLSQLLHRPWTLFTYMFLHEGFLHILFNMLWLYWFGKIFLQYLSEKQLLNVYLMGGLAGAALYIAAFNIFPVFQNVLPNSFALGASASVLAIVIAISVYVPDYTIYLMFLGPVKLKYIALVSILLDIVSIAGTNSGGHIAHLGGALIGYLFISRLRKGRDISSQFGIFTGKFLSLFKRKPKMKVTYKKPMSDMEYNAQKVTKQEEIDKILDKIAKSGYDSLTKKEKEILFKMSSK
ncbi:MAG: rhomboid family intramembrane serine protease [Chlorobi bacterium]|nr:rhomboid family intramembrane serine protease [Chlorobiota bacterium]